MSVKSSDDLLQLLKEDTSSTNTFTGQWCTADCVSTLTFILMCLNTHNHCGGDGNLATAVFWKICQWCVNAPTDKH